MKIEKNLLIPSEMQECHAYWEWAQTIPSLRDYLYKIVNEGKRSPVSGYRLNQIGLRRGVPDYHYPVSNGTYIGLWIEMKTRDRKNSALPECQHEWIAKLNEARHYATFAFGWEDAADITTAYLKDNLERRT